MTPTDAVLAFVAQVAEWQVYCDNNPARLAQVETNLDPAR